MRVPGEVGRPPPCFFKKDYLVTSYHENCEKSNMVFFTGFLIHTCIFLNVTFEAFSCSRWPCAVLRTERRVILRYRSNLVNVPEFSCWSWWVAKAKATITTYCTITNTIGVINDNKFMKVRRLSRVNSRGSSSPNGNCSSTPG